MRVFNSIREAVNALTYLFEVQMEDAPIFRDIGEITVSNIVNRTKAGYGVAEDGALKQRLKPLSENYKIFRQEYSSLLGDRAKIKKSNLTFTGQMLSSIKYKAKKGSVNIFFNNDRAEYKAYMNERNGRPFFHLSKSELKDVQRILERARDEYITRFFS